jgi:hypothetical protein
MGYGELLQRKVRQFFGMYHKNHVYNEKLGKYRIISVKELGDV